MLNFLSESNDPECNPNFQHVNDSNQILHMIQIKYQNHQNSNVITCDLSYSCGNDKIITFKGLKRK